MDNERTRHSHSYRPKTPRGDPQRDCRHQRCNEGQGRWDGIEHSEHGGDRERGNHEREDSAYGPGTGKFSYRSQYSVPFLW